MPTFTCRSSPILSLLNRPFSDPILAAMSAIVDDKSEHAVPFILQSFELHQTRYSSDRDLIPFFVGLSGVQGSGKTTLVSSKLFL